MNFFNYCDEKKIGKCGWDSVNKYHVYSFNLDEINELRLDNTIVENYDNGLVLGNSHNTGHIWLIQKINDNEFICYQTIQGWEYIIQPPTSYNKMISLIEINKGYDETIPFGFEIPKDCNIIGMNSESKFQLLLTNSKVFIVNHVSTMKYIRTLISIND